MAGGRSDSEEVEGAVFEGFMARAQTMRVRLHRDQCAEAGRIAEEFVERERGKVRLALAKAESVARRECGNFEQHIESAVVRFFDKRERVPNSGEVRLSGEPEQSSVASVRRRNSSSSGR